MAKQLSISPVQLRRARASQQKQTRMRQERYCVCLKHESVSTRYVFVWAESSDDALKVAQGKCDRNERPSYVLTPDEVKQMERLSSAFD